MLWQKIRLPALILIFVVLSWRFCWLPQLECWIKHPELIIGKPKTGSNFLKKNIQVRLKLRHQNIIKKVIISKCRSSHPKICKAKFLKLHFGLGVLQKTCWIFSKHLFPGTPQGGCLWKCLFKIVFKIAPHFYQRQ